MKKTNRIIGLVILGLAATAVTGIVCEVRKRKALGRLSEASANEGYELAPDIIYPDKYASKRHKKLRYGPVF